MSVKYLFIEKESSWGLKIIGYYMEVKVSRIRVIGFLRMRDSGEGNIRIGSTMKLMVGGKWTGNSKRRA